MPTVFAIIVTGLEARSGFPCNSIVSNAGDRFWVTIEDSVGASSTHFRSYDEVPRHAKTFMSSEVAEKFAKQWKGHPWWCRPSGEYEIVELHPKYRRVPDGYVAVAAS